MKYKLSKLISNITLTISIFVVLTLGTAWIIKEYTDFSKNINQLQSNYVDEKKKEISQEVNRVISLIDYNYSLKMNRTKKQVKQRVLEAHNLVTKLYEANKDTKSKEQIIEIIKDTLRNIRFFDGVGYYIIYDLEGKSILHPIKPDVENTYKFKNFKDLNGKEVLTSWFENLKTKNEDYSKWTFYRVDDKQKQAVKVGYYKKFEPYGFVIATADYLYRVENELKEETLDRIRQIHYGKTGNIFVVDKFGKTLVTKHFSSLEGKHFSDMKNNQAQKIVQLIIKNASPVGEYITYDWFKPNTIYYQEKLSYVKLYDKWDWIIGTGVFFDEINDKIEKENDKLNNNIIFEIEFILFVIFIILLVIFVVNSYINKKIKNSLELFLGFFKNVDEKNEKIDENSLEFYEFYKIAKYANKMIDLRKENEKEIDTKNREVLINLSLLDEYKKAVDAGAIVSKSDASGVITYVNDQFCEISGYSKEELIGYNHSLVKHPEVPDRFFKSLWTKIADKKIWKGVFKNRAKDGSTYYVKSTIVPILDIYGNIKEFIAIRYDVTDLINQAKKIKFQTTDLLTKLPNRQKLLEDLTNRDDLKLLVLNVERFKEVNEYYGYEMGDKLLTKLADELNKLIDLDELNLYKLQGDEFAVLGNELITQEEFKEISYALMSKLKSIPVEVDENVLDVHFIGGISFIKNYFINAEMAKNYAKQEKKRLVIFDENRDIKDNIINNVQWTRKLKTKIAEDKIVVVAQPIFSNSNGKVNKYECLVRMEDDDGSLISPIKFLNIAKKSKLYTKLTRIVVRKSFEHFANTNDKFSINLTIEDILDIKTVNFIKESLDKYKNISNRVIFEIVEDEGIENYEEVSSFIEQMKYLGCSIAIDDFGTGYSNFDYLMKLNVDYVKIDGSMIRYLDCDDNAKVVTELVVKFAQKLNIKTIAEFVHSKEIHEIVTDMGINYSQGFYLAEPKRI